MSKAKILKVTVEHPEPELIEEAARVLTKGGLVGFPTETVYGIATDPSNAKAMERLNEVKGRPPEKQYSIHIYDISQLKEFVDEISPIAKKLMDRFWPGPLTIVMPSKKGDGVGFRFPNHPVAAAFLRACKCPVVAPSANRSGFAPPTDGKEALDAIGDSIDCLLDSGPTAMGRESTVVSVLGSRLQVLREGVIPSEEIHAVI